MNHKNHTMSFIKKAVFLLHIGFAAIALSGITFMFHSSEFGKGINWVRYESYDDTQLFTSQVEQDINQIFHYVKYQAIFETDGQLDLKKKMASVSPSPGDDKEYTLEELIRYGKLHGYSLDGKYELTTTPVDLYEDDSVTINWLAYDQDREMTEPSDAYTTVEEISVDVLELLGEYMKVKDHLFMTPSNLRFRIVYNWQSQSPYIYTNCPELSMDDIRSIGRYCYSDSSQVLMETNFTSSPDNLVTLLEADNPLQGKPYAMALSVDTNYPEADQYQQSYLTYQQMRIWFIAGMLCTAVGLLGCLITMYYMIINCGRVSSKSLEIRLFQFDRISTESIILLSVAALLLLLAAGERTAYPILHLFTAKKHWAYAERMFRSVVIYLCFLTCFFSLLRRYKARTLWNNSTLRRSLIQSAKYLQKRSFTYRLILSYLTFWAINVLFISILLIHLFSGGLSHSGWLTASMAVAWIVFDIVVFHRLYRIAYENDQIFEALIHMEGGGTDYQIDISDFHGKELDIAQKLNQISNGLETALTEKVKSERMKADLITNVSHDLKTPLTSIISYVDLIKREQIDNPKIQGYLEVLDQKSLRLKTLTEDLVEISKASSGNLTLEITDIDLVEMIHQTNGEFEEKFSTRRLNLVPTLPDKAILIEADGRRLWRVLENLYNNVCKYAMENSRVYVDVACDGKQARLTIKNISQTPLNIQGDELTERFVRGDVSRSTDGSGLGLSIAKTLTNLQKGTFEIIVDGDLFKVVVSFPRKRPRSIQE